MLFINIGRKDSLNPGKLIGLINEQNIGDKVEIGAIDILDTFSFFEIDKNFEDKTLDAFAANQPDFEGRSVNVEVTKKERSGGGRRGGKKSFGKKRVVLEEEEVLKEVLQEKVMVEEEMLTNQTDVLHLKDQEVLETENLVDLEENVEILK